MGKKRIKLVDALAEEQAADKPHRKAGKPKKMAKPETEAVSPPRAEAEIGETAPETPLKTKAKPVRVRSQRYQSLRGQVNPEKAYPIEEAAALVCSLANAGFDETVELHAVTKKESVAGAVKLPHGTGKSQKIVVFDPQVEAQIKAQKFAFDLLVAKPSDMATIARYARFLGPKGLMPNPKNGTISDHPEAAVGCLKQEVHYKTEKKAPLIHAVVGKVSFGQEKLRENVRAFLAALDPKQLVKASICSSMGPGIKLKLE